MTPLSFHLAFLSTRGADNDIELKIINNFIRALRDKNRNYVAFIEGGFEVCDFLIFFF